MKNKLWLILCFIVLTGCGGSNQPEQASAAESSLPADIQAQRDAMVAMRSDSIYKQTESLLKQGIAGIDLLEGTVERDGNTFTVTTWMENSRAIADIVNTSDDMRDAWSDLKDSFIQISDAASGFASESDFPVNIMFYFVNDTDHNDHLLEITDGICTMDVTQ